MYGCYETYTVEHQFHEYCRLVQKRWCHTTVNPGTFQKHTNQNMMERPHTLALFVCSDNKKEQCFLPAYLVRLSWRSTKEIRKNQNHAKAYRWMSRLRKKMRQGQSTCDASDTAEKGMHKVAQGTRERGKKHVCAMLCYWLQGLFQKMGVGGGGICAHLEHQIMGQTDEGENVFFRMALNNETAAHPCHRNLKLFLPY